MQKYLILWLITKEMGRIEIEGMEFYSFHGHYPVEQEVGNKFLIDLVLDADLGKASQTDNLEDTINYQQVYEIVKKEMEINSHLLEHIAGRILNQLHQAFDSLIKTKIKISKMNPPLGGQIQKVSVVMEKTKV
jgi:dihydroneopterin aldolase